MQIFFLFLYHSPFFNKYFYYHSPKFNIHFYYHSPFFVGSQGCEPTGVDGLLATAWLVNRLRPCKLKHVATPLCSFLCLSLSK